MLSLITAPLSVLHLWIPLALTAKSLQSESPQSHAFLLHYWAWYVLLSYLHFLVSSWGLFFLAGAVDLALAGAKLWLFYAHGCMVLSRFYLPRALFAATGLASLADFEAKLIDPFVTFLARNKILQKGLSFFESSKNSGLARSLAAFNRELCKRQCLAVGVDFVCYLDLPRQLAERVQAIERFLAFLRGFVENDKTSPPPKTSLNPNLRSALGGLGHRGSSSSLGARKSSRSNLGLAPGSRTNLAKKPSKLNLNPAQFEDQKRNFSPRGNFDSHRANFDFSDPEFDLEYEAETLDVGFLPQYSEFSPNRSGGADLPLLRKTRKPPMPESEYTSRRHRRSSSVGGLPYPFEDPNPADPGKRSVSEVVRSLGRTSGYERT